MRLTVLAKVLLILLGAFILTSASVAFAQSQSWQPPEPAPEQHDWIKLTSGEWLRGTLEVLRDTDLEFDSEELDLLKLDWEDVAELRSPRLLSYRFEDIGIFTGTAIMRDGTVAIGMEEGVQEFSREQLISILAEGKGELSLWSANMSLGLVARSGNTDQKDVNTKLNIRRQTTRTRLDFRYVGNIGTVQGEQNINNHNVTSFFDLLVAAGFYVTPVSYNYVRDPFTNINYRNTLGAGVGYVISRGGKIEWSVGLGGGYQVTSFVSVQEGSDDILRNGSIIPATDVEWDITKDLELDFHYDVQIGVPETKNSFHHLSAVFSMDVWGDLLDLDFSFYWDRNENPQADADGNVPKRDDYRTVFGFGIDF